MEEAEHVLSTKPHLKLHLEPLLLLVIPFSILIISMQRQSTILKEMETCSRQCVHTWEARELPL